MREKIRIKKKNKTTSKEKNSKITNISINNIKNIHYININNIKTNYLTKTCENNNKMNLYRKMTEATKTQRESSKSNSKKKVNSLLKNTNFNKIKPELFKNYINLQNIKKNVNSKKTKKINKEIKKKIKNNKTMNNDLIPKNKDFNLSVNNNNNIIIKNNSLAMDKNALKKGIFLSKNYNNKFLMNYKIKLKKLKNINNELSKQKIFTNNVQKMSLKDYDTSSNLKNLKINNIKIERLSKISNLLNDVRTSRACQNRYIINSVSNSRSKSKSQSKTGGTRTSNSSNSRSTSIRDRLKKECFFAFKSSRNNNSKNKSGNKNIKKYINLTQEFLSNLKCFKPINIKGKDNRKYFEYNINLINKKDKVRGNTFSKSKKKVSSKSKNINNYCNKVHNYRTSKEQHKLKKKIKNSNHMNILINDINNNTIQRYDTMKKSEKNMRGSGIINRQNNLLHKSNANNFKNNLKNKINLHNIKNLIKFKEYNKYTIFNNTSNFIQDEQSQEFNNDYSNIKAPSKHKINKIINNSKNNRSNQNNKLTKKIKIGDLKSLQIKNLKIYQDIKPQTYRKEKKLEESMFNNDTKIKDNNIIYPSINFTNFYNNTGNTKNKK